MDAQALVGMVLDIGLGASALHLARSLTARVKVNEQRHDKVDVVLADHEVRIVKLENA